MVLPSQFCSSPLSEQSFSPSHTHLYGIHRASFGHLNLPEEHVMCGSPEKTVGCKGLFTPSKSENIFRLNFLFDLFRLFFDLFRVRFLSVWMGPCLALSKFRLKIGILRSHAATLCKMATPIYTNQLTGHYLIIIKQPECFTKSSAPLPPPFNE